MSSSGQESSGSNAKQQSVKPRAPRASKTELFMQQKLAPYKTNDPTCPDCWHAYKWAKADEKDIKRQQKDEAKRSQPPVDQIRSLLSEAARHGNFADQLADKPGKEKQSIGMRKTADAKMNDAIKIFQQLSEDEKSQLDEQEQHWLCHKEVPALSEYFDGSIESEANAEADKKIQQGKQIEKLVQEREQLHRRLSKFERELAQTKQLSEKMKQEIYQLLHTVKDKSIKSRLQQILELEKSSTQ